MGPYLLPPVHCARTDPSVHLLVKPSEVVYAKSMSPPYWVMMSNMDGLICNLARFITSPNVMKKRIQSPQNAGKILLED